MGLLLSVLVACVGVVELLAFCSNVRRNFVAVSTQTNLNEISKRYLDELELHRRNLQIQIDQSKCLLERKSRSPSPRSCLLTAEKRRSRSPSPRLVVTFSSKDYEIQSEDESTAKVIVEELIAIEESSVLETDIKPHSRSPSPIPRSVEQDVAFRRSPSPYPSLVLPVPRNSICSELLDNAAVAEVEEEISRSPTPEKIQAILASKHNTAEYWTNKILVVPKRTHSHSHSESFFSSSKLGRSLSLSETSTSSTSESSKFTQIDFALSTKDDFEIEQIKEYDERFLDSLDGVKNKKLSRNSSLRRSKKKKALNVSFDNESKDDCLSSSSMQNNDAQTAKTLTEAANVLKNVNQEAGGPSKSAAGSSKTAEPFWVNH